MGLTFGKKEKLKSRKRITQLFEEGLTVSKFPVKVFYLPVEDAQHTQVTFAVPKRNFKSAVIRNRIKRQLRESYRLQKETLATDKNTRFAILFLYLSKDKPVSKTLMSAMAVLLQKVSKESKQ